MSLTILFDLDDTLLVNPINEFMQAYLKLLSNHLSRFVEPNAMVSNLLHATDGMIKKDKPCNTLETTFDSVFYPALDIEKASLMHEIDRFYEEEFPKLSGITTPIPEVVRIMDHVFSKGYDVVIATNPLFPLKAIKHRLAWAGIPVEKYPYKLITSYEKMHFAKPNGAYYAEILGVMGWQEQPACMVGNNLQDDIYPASQMGLHTYFIGGEKLHPNKTGLMNFSQGSISNLIPWIEKVASQGPVADFQDAFSIMSMLKSTPAVLDNLTGHLSEKDWQARPIPNEWSILEIICHLRDVEKEINLPRINQLLMEDDPFIAGIDSDIWASEREYNSQYTPSAFLDFCATRDHVLEIFKSLTSEDWNKKARHSIFGPTNLIELFGFVTTHDRNHIHQVSSTIQSL